jgi:hypothetical protein
MSNDTYYGIYLKGGYNHWLKLEMKKQLLWDILKEKLSCEKIDYILIYGGFYIFFDQEHAKKNEPYNKTVLAANEDAKFFKGDGVLVCIGDHKDFAKVSIQFKDFITWELQERYEYMTTMKKRKRDSLIRKHGLLGYR